MGFLSKIIKIGSSIKYILKVVVVFFMSKPSINITP